MDMRRSAAQGIRPNTGMRNFFTQKSVGQSAIPIGNKIKIKFIKELHFQARKRAIFRKR